MENVISFAIYEYKEYFESHVENVECCLARLSAMSLHCLDTRLGTIH